MSSVQVSESHPYQVNGNPHILDHVERLESTEETALPKHEEDDGFDREKLQERLVMLDPARDGKVKLDQTVHRN